MTQKKTGQTNGSRPTRSRNNTERKRAEAALRASEATYQAIFNAANEGILVLDMDTGQVVDANATFCTVFGYTPEETRGLRVEEFSSGEAPYIQEDALRLIRQAARGEQQRFEWRAKSRDGRLLWIDVTLKRATIAGRDRVLAIGRDITERKRAEEALRESQERYRLLAENVTDVIWTADMDLNLTYISPSDQRLTGYPPQERSGLTAREALTPTSLEAAEAALAEELAIEGREQKDLTRSRTMEVEVYRKDGSTVWAEMEVTFLRDPDGRPVGILGVTRDITERKRAEEALRDSEERFRAIVENAPFGYYRVGKEGLWQYVNPVWERMHGYSLKDVMGKPFEITQTREDVEKARQLVKQALAGETITGEFSRTTRLGTIEYHSFNIQPVRQGNEIVAIEGFINDITERKQAEEALRETRDYLEKLIDYANAPITVWDTNFTITRFNHAFERLTGRPAGEVVGQRLEVLFPEAERAASMEQIARALRGEFWELIEISILHQNGEVRRVLWNSANIAGPDGRTVVATIAQGTDITERKQAEETLRETRDYLEKLIDYANAPIIVWDPNFTITRFNHAFERLTGRPAGEVVGQRLEVLFPEAERAASMEQIARALRGEFWELIEISILHQNGEVRRVLWNSANIAGPDGRTVVATIAQGTDITERKQAEEALRETTQTLQALIQASPLAILTMDPQGNVRTWNPAAERTFGWSEQEAVGRPNPIIPEDRQNEFRALLDAVLQGNLFSKAETRRRRKDGSLIDVSLSTAAMRNATGDIIGVMSMLDDITERKRAEEALRESEQRFRKVFEEGPLGMSIIDLDYQFVKANPTLCQMVGYTEQELSALTFRDITHPDHIEADLQHTQKLFARDIPYYKVEKRYIKKDGEIIWVTLTASVIRDEDGRPLYGLAMIEDITERKQAEETLQKAREELEARVERQMEQGNPYGLTFRELTVLHIVAAGKADKEIGSELGISPLTASKHLTNILSKMDAASRTEACVRALREGLLD